MPRRLLKRASKPKSAKHPGAEAAFLQVAGGGVAVGQQRRGQVELEAVPALELGPELALEGAVGVEPGHLVLVLVGHELEEVARDRLGERWAAGEDGRLACPHALDRRPVAGGIGGVLVVGEEGRALVDQLVERARCAACAASPARATASTAAGRAAARRPQRKACG